MRRRRIRKVHVDPTRRAMMDEVDVVAVLVRRRKSPPWAEKREKKTKKLG